MESYSDRYYMCSLLKNKRLMVAWELVPFLELCDVRKFLKLNKAAASIIKEHYSDKWDQLSEFMAQNYWKIPIEELKALDVPNYDELCKLHNKPIKCIDKEYVYRKFNKEKKAFDTMVYAGNFWAWKDNDQYWNEVDCERSIDFGFPNMKIPHLISVCWLDIELEAQDVVNGKYRIYLLDALDRGAHIKESLSLTISFSSPKNLDTD